MKSLHDFRREVLHAARHFRQGKGTAATAERKTIALRQAQQRVREGKPPDERQLPGVRLAREKASDLFFERVHRAADACFATFREYPARVAFPFDKGKGPPFEYARLYVSDSNATFEIIVRVLPVHARKQWSEHEKETLFWAQLPRSNDWYEGDELAKIASTLRTVSEHPQ